METISFAVKDVENVIFILNTMLIPVFVSNNGI